MENKLIYINRILNEVLKDKVYYALQVQQDASFPFIVYQEISKRSVKYHDDHSFMKQSVIQVTLVTKNKKLLLERKLEEKLTDEDLDYQMISEYYIKDSGLYRVYEIKMEEFRHEQ